MKIAIAQLNFHIGNFEKNTEKIIKNVIKAKNQGADLIIFAELAICGYPPRDFLEFSDFIHQCDIHIDKIAEQSDDIGIIIGSPSVNTSGKGKTLFNSAYFLYEKKIQHITHKSLLPTYDIFDEYRYFEPASSSRCINFKGEKIALTICEDLWNLDNNPLYVINPMDWLMKENPDLIINIAASPFHYNQAKIRKDILSKNAKTYGIPLFYVNHVGAQTELLFDGGSLVMNSNGELVDEFIYFEESFKLFNSKQLQQQTIKEEEPKIGLIYQALVMGLKNYFQKLNFKQAILGLSGGIDSALTLAIATEALGKENVWPILLPSQYSSQHSIDDSVELANNLGVKYDIIPIEENFHSFEKSLHPFFKNLPFGIAEENIQARSRGVILMALSNKFGHVLLNTSNKSEAAVGYGTLYGDMCGGLSVIGDIYKIEVFEMCNYINRHQEIIPDNIITKPPSAELRPDQKDSDSLPDYDILDAILHQYIELKMGPKEIISAGYDPQLVERILKLVNQNEYKRYQTPPMLRVSPKAFGMGRRMPIVAKYLT